MSEKKLYRSRSNRVIAGVCGGLGEYFGIDPTVMRVIFVVATIFLAGIGGILAYAILWGIVPEGPNGAAGTGAAMTSSGARPPANR